MITYSPIFQIRLLFFLHIHCCPLASHSLGGEGGEQRSRERRWVFRSIESPQHSAILFAEYLCTWWRFQSTTFFPRQIVNTSDMICWAKLHGWPSSAVGERDCGINNWATATPRAEREEKRRRRNVEGSISHMRSSHCPFNISKLTNWFVAGYHLDNRNWHLRQTDQLRSLFARPVLQPLRQMRWIHFNC